MLDGKSSPVPENWAQRRDDEQEPAHLGYRSLTPQNPYSVFETVNPYRNPNESTPLVSSSLSAPGEGFNNTCSDDDSKFSKWTPTFVLCVFCAVMGCAFPIGFDMCCLIGPREVITDFINKSNEERELYSSLKSDDVFCLIFSTSFLFAVPGCALGALVSNKVGRKGAHYMNCALLFTGASSMFLSKHLGFWELLVLGRFIMGLFVGSSSVATNVYLSEIAPKYSRASVGGFYLLGLEFGLFSASFLGIRFFLLREDYWHYLFSVPVFISSAHSILLLFCPESPKFLYINKKNHKAARNALKRLRGKVSVTSLNAELLSIEHEQQYDLNNHRPSSANFLKIGHYRRPILLAIILVIGSQMSGAITVSLRSADFFDQIVQDGSSKYSEDYPQVFMMFMLFAQIIGSLAFISAVETIGRKLTFMISFALMTLCLIGIGFLMSGFPSSKMLCHKIFAIYGNSNFFVVFILFIFSGSFAFGVGSLPWILTPELFTMAARARAVAVANSFNFLSIFAAYHLYLPLINEVCGHVFWVFGAVAVLWFAYVGIVLPRFDEMTSVDINHLFSDSWRRSSNRSTLSRNSSIPYTHTASITHNENGCW